MATTNLTTVGGVKFTRTAATAFVAAAINRLVKLTAANTIGVCGSGELPEGVILQVADAGDEATIGRKGEFLVEVGVGGVTRGTEVMSDASGKVVVFTAMTAISPAGAVAVLSDATPVTMDILGGALPTKRAGIAVDSGSDGDFVRVWID